MNRIIANVSRWQRPAGVRRFSSRWTAWACALTERYAWTAVRRPGLGLGLAYPGAPIYRFYQRWEQHAWTYAPRLHLAISLRPGQMDREGRPTAAAVHMHGAARRQLAPVREDATVYPPVIGRQVTGSLPAPTFPAASARPAVVTALGDSPGPPPLRRVWRRAGLEAVHETVLASVVNRESLVTRRSRQILHRLLEERQRIEVLASLSLVMRQQQYPAPAGAGAETASTVRQSPWGPRVGAPGMAQQATAPAAIDLDLLTEKVVRQIDQRIVAYRERMGKLF